MSTHRAPYLRRTTVVKILQEMSVWLEPQKEKGRAQLYNLNLEEPAEVERLRQRILKLLEKE